MIEIAPPETCHITTVTSVFCILVKLFCNLEEKNETNKETKKTMFIISQL